MRGWRSAAGATVAFLQLLAGDAWAQLASEPVVLYGVASECDDCEPTPGTLYTIDPETAVATEVGPILDTLDQPVFEVSGMAFTRDGTLYGVAEADPPILIEIDPATGRAERIGAITTGCNTVASLTYQASSSTLFGIGRDCLISNPNPPPVVFFRSQLFSIDPDDGEGTRVGDTGTIGAGAGLTWWPMEGTFRYAPAEDDALFDVSTETGDAVEVPGTKGNVGADFDSEGLDALDFHPLDGRLFGALIDASEGSFLVTVDPDDGTTTEVGPLRLADDTPLENFDALVFRAPAGCTNGPIGAAADPPPREGDEPEVPQDELPPPTVELGEGDCRAAGSNGSKIKLGNDKLRENWSWKGESTPASAFGDPTADTDYRVCIYQAGAGKPSLKSAQRVPSGEGWRAKSKGFDYKSRDGAPDGIRSVKIKEGTDRKARVKVDGRDVDLLDLPIPVDECIIDCLVVQLQNDLGECWESRFTNLPKNNREGFFRAKN